ncbi:MAG: hypothetical protein HY870_02575 [Chloroflexi bacterium]|nr:hypothetical protein [Chloroflexota bacterium]
MRLLLIGIAGSLIACYSRAWPPVHTVSPTPASTPALKADLQLTPAAQAQSLSTPALIEQALAQGEITSEQRLLYLAYAIYEYESLPAQFRSEAGWRGTSIVEELRRASRQSSIICSLSPTVQTELRRLLKEVAACDNVR